MQQNQTGVGAGSTCVECGEQIPAGQTKWCALGGLCSWYVPRMLRADGSLEERGEVYFRVETKQVTEDALQWRSVPRPFDFIGVKEARVRRGQFDACPYFPATPAWETRIVKITREIVA